MDLKRVYQSVINLIVDFGFFLLFYNIADYLDWL